MKTLGLSHNTIILWVLMLQVGICSLSFCYAEGRQVQDLSDLESKSVFEIKEREYQKYINLMVEKLEQEGYDFSGLKDGKESIVYNPALEKDGMTLAPKEKKLFSNEYVQADKPTIHIGKKTFTKFHTLLGLRMNILHELDHVKQLPGVDEVMSRTNAHNEVDAYIAEWIRLGEYESAEDFRNAVAEKLLKEYEIFEDEQGDSELIRRYKPIVESIKKIYQKNIAKVSNKKQTTSDFSLIPEDMDRFRKLWDVSEPSSFPEFSLSNGDFDRFTSLDNISKPKTEVVPVLKPSMPDWSKHPDYRPKNYYTDYGKIQSYRPPTRSTPTYNPSSYSRPRYRLETRPLLSVPRPARKK
jgi:hypothetical protein